MNEDGSLGIPHGASQEEETPIAEPNFSSNQEDTGISSTGASAVDDTAISHDSPIEAPIDAGSGEEPVDIFASPEEKAAEAESASMPGEAPTAITSGSSNSHSITNNPFHNRNRFQANTNTTNSNIPQFFSDSMVASTPISQPRQSKKGIIIGAAIGCAALICIILLVVSFISGKNPIVANIDLGSIKTKYNKLANYIISGEEKDNKIDTTFGAKENYYFYDIRKSEEEFKNITTKTKALEEDLLDAAKSIKNNQKYASIYTSISKQADTLYSLEAFYSKKPLSYDDIMADYLSNGKEATLSKIDNYYGINQFGALKTYNEATKNLANEIIEIAELAKKYKCVNNNQINTACTYGKASKEDRKSLDDHFSSASDYTQERNAFYSLEQEYVSSVIDLGNILNKNGEQAND